MNNETKIVIDSNVVMKAMRVFLMLCVIKLCPGIEGFCQIIFFKKVKSVDAVNVDVLRRAKNTIAKVTLTYLYLQSKNSLFLRNKYL